MASQIFQHDIQSTAKVFGRSCRSIETVPVWSKSASGTCWIPYAVQNLQVDGMMKCIHVINILQRFNLCRGCFFRAWTTPLTTKPINNHSGAYLALNIAKNSRATRSGVECLPLALSWEAEFDTHQQNNHIKNICYGSIVKWVKPVMFHSCV